MRNSVDYRNVATLDGREPAACELNDLVLSARLVLLFKS